MINPRPLLYKLGLSESEATLYLKLIEDGALTAAELTKATQSKRPTVYYALRQLSDRGLVQKSGVPGVERFQAEAPEKLVTILKLREQELQALEEELRMMIPQMVPSSVAREGVPSVSFYEGEAAMKQAIMETLYCRSRHIDTLTPQDNFFWQTKDQVFADRYVMERKNRKITTRHLWEALLTPANMTRFFPPQAQIRILPKTMHGAFRTSVFLYDDKVMYVSSQKSGYVLVVKSKEHHELMSSIYNSLWEAASQGAVDKK